MIRFSSRHGYAAVFWLPALLVVANLVTGCWSRSEEPATLPDVTSLRFIEEDPETFLDSSDLLIQIPVLSWHGREELAVWIAESPGTSLVPSTTSDGVNVAVTETPGVLSVSLEKPIPATRGMTLELDITDIHRHDIEMSWIRDGESTPCDTCRLVESLPARSEGRMKTFRFELSPNDSWSGEVTELRLALHVPPDKRTEVRGVRLLQERPIVQKIAESQKRAWKLDLANDVRNVLLGGPGQTHQRSLKVPTGGRLVFGYGIEPGGAVGSTFSVHVNRDQQESELVFSDTVDRSDIWHEAVVDLSRFSGQFVELSLSTISTVDAEPTGRFLAWSNPRVASGLNLGRPNIVLISIDTLRPDHLSGYGYHRPTSPNLDRWSEQGVIFDNAIAQAPWTLPSHVSMLSGLDAATHGVNGSEPAPGRVHFLAEMLREAGYTTQAVTGGGFVHPQWGFSQGFDSYRYFGVSMGFKGELESELSLASEWIRSEQTPFFLFFHTYSVHNPYRARRPFYDQFSSIPRGHSLKVNSPEPVANDGYLTRRTFSLRLPSGDLVSPVPATYSELGTDLYDSEVAFLDQQIGGWLEQLTDLGSRYPTLVIFTSDHGELFGEHGLINHSSLYEENLRVPLILVGEGVEPGRRITEQVRSIDIVPTVLEIAGLDSPVELDGVSLSRYLNELDPEEVESGNTTGAWSYVPATNFGISLRIDNRLKYILQNGLWTSNQSKEELYELDRDPLEQDNLIDTSAETPQLRSLVERYIQERIQGVRFRFFNKTDQPLQGFSRWIGCFVKGT